MKKLASLLTDKRLTDLCPPMDLGGCNVLIKYNTPLLNSFAVERLALRGSAIFTAK